MTSSVLKEKEKEEEEPFICSSYREVSDNRKRCTTSVML
jgi:hypothetical protein